MITAMTFHGSIGEEIEFYATVSGKGLVHKYFYEPGASSDRERFFYAGKEFVLDKDGISHKGNGGSFCEYMFGIELPLRDLVRKDVLNRLAMYGARFDKDDSRIVFTKKTDGRQSYDSIFLDGNAVSNYYYFVDVNLPGDISVRQEQITRLVGKTLKYSSSIGFGHDNSLMAELTADLDGYEPVIFLFRIIHRYQKRFYDLFKEIYDECKAVGEDVSEEGNKLLNALAREFKIDQYQQERIKIDVIYKHPDNKRVVDEYKDILISFEHKEELGTTDVAALNRLRSLAIRNHIPHFLFDLLDEMLLKGKQIVSGKIPSYLKDSRLMLDGLFVAEGVLANVIDKEGIIKLLNDKKQSIENRDQAFDSLLLQVGATCDEKFQRGDTGPLERFSELITYFDRFDTTLSMINRIAFMDENVGIDKLRSIIGTKRAFNEIDKRLFAQLFISDLLENKYLTYFGRRKIQALKKGLNEVEDGYKSMNDVAGGITRINAEDRMYILLYKTASERLKRIPEVINGKAITDKFIKEVLKGLLRDGPIKKIPKSVMKRVFVALKMEVFYISELLPRIVASSNMKSREDFLINSGFDRFLIEDIEREYLDGSGLTVEDKKRFWDLVGQG